MLPPLKRFSMPSSNSNVNEILSYILELQQSIIRIYDDFLHRIRDRDDVTNHVLPEILEHEIRRESEMESGLAVGGDGYPHIQDNMTALRSIIMLDLPFRDV